MTTFERYDRWLHRRIMNPAFTWIQKLFRRNRYQLIRWFLQVIIITFAVAILLLILSCLNGKWFDGILCFVYLRLNVRNWKWYARHESSLRKAAQDYEARRVVRLPAELVIYANLYRDHRPIVSAVCTFLTAMMTFPLALGLGGFHDVNLVVLVLSMLMEAHLWDLDDVDPQDRVSLLEPKTASDTA